MERQPDSLDGIPSALRFVPLAGVVGWVLVAGYAVVYVLSR